MFRGVDDSETERLVNTDLSNLTGPELRAHLGAVERRMTELKRTELELLERSSELVADRPELRARLEYLRTLDLSGPGS